MKLKVKIFGRTQYFVFSNKFLLNLLEYLENRQESKFVSPINEELAKKLILKDGREIPGQNKYQALMRTNVSCLSKELNVAVDKVARKQCEQLRCSRRYRRQDDVSDVRPN